MNPVNLINKKTIESYLHQKNLTGVFVIDMLGFKTYGVVCMIVVFYYQTKTRFYYYYRV